MTAMEKKEFLTNSEVFRDTMEQANGKFLQDTKDLVENRTFVYTEKITDMQIMPPVKPMPNPKMTRFVVEMGTVEAGKRLKETTGKRTAILNFADAIRPGGYVIEGAPTQEENICRCSNLYPTLVAEDRFDKYYFVNYNNLYPENIYGDVFPEHEGLDWTALTVKPGYYTDRLIYSRDVLFFKNDSTYEEEEPYTLDVITCPAPNIDWSQLGALDADEYSVIVERAEQIIKSAILNKVDNLVLGAWGCGAFMQNPEVISKAFMEVLGKYGCFDNVTFAIRCTTAGWLDNNYNTFLKNCGGK